MSGKSSKKEKKATREAQREALRKQERQRTIFTAIVIVVVVAIGGVLVAVSLQDPTSPEDELAELLEGVETEDPEGAEGEEAGAEPVADRPVACGADEPAGAGEDRETYDEPDDVLEDGLDYQAVVETSCGTVVIDLDEENAPESVNSFVFLAQEGFFDAREIFRNATSIDALQTGSGTDDASWQLGYTLTDELETAESQGYPAGSVAMANAGPNTSGSQFFMVYGDGFDAAIESGGGLEPVYTRFGMVLEGLDIVAEIGAIEAAGERGETPTERIYMESVTITTG